MRAAIFFTPPVDDPLTAAAANWLGRDAFTGADLRQPPVAGFDAAEFAALTGAPRRYGFHATLKAPFRLDEVVTLDEVERALETLCRDLAPVSLGMLRAARIGSFLALVPAGDTAAVNALAAKVVRHFDPYRAPPTAEETAQRRPASLTVPQQENLVRWGYPYVFSDYRFHMTLTGAVPANRRHDMARAIAERFGLLLTRPVAIESLSLFVAADPSGNFLVRRTVPLAQADARAGAA